ncbi:hypothetical protein BH10ACT7_BH10ACT7_05080 [soil metagenome]
MIALVPQNHGFMRFCTDAHLPVQRSGCAPDAVRMRRTLLLLSSLALVAVASSPASGALPRWRWPVDTPHPVVRPYIAPASPYAPGHRGIDIAAPAGTVYAPAGGTVHFAGTVVDRPVLSIRHSGGLLSSYEPVTTSLHAGDGVARGQVIGSVSSGHCASACLHFGVRLHGEYISPLSLLGEIPRAVLLPTRGSS